MDRAELRRLQEPLKKQYRDEPESAVVTLTADGSLGEGVSCSVQTGRALAEAGLHPATGGDGLSLCSGDMLLQAPVGFSAIRLRFDLDTDAGPDDIATLLRLTERYCVVYQTLASAPAISVTA